MNRLLFILFLIAFNAGAQPLWRAPWTTNVPPALISVNDANGGAVTNIGANGAHYGLWHFYGNDSNTIARLGDLTSGGGAGGESNATYLVLGLTNALPNAHRLLSDMATILQLTNGADIIHRVSDTISNWGRFSTNMISDTASNAAQNIADGKISIQGGAGNNNILTNLTLQNSASVFSPNAGATFPFGIGQSGNDLVFSHPDTTDQILMTSTGLVANGSAVTNLPTSLTNSTHYDPTAGSKGLKTWSAGNGIALTNEAGSNLVAAIDPAIVASQANLTSASNTLRTTFIANDTITSNGAVAFAMTVSNAVAGIVGETNWNGEVSVTNSGRFGWVNGKANNTNLLRSFQPANGLKGTNESGTNISLAIDPTVVASQANLTSASNTLRTDISNLQASGLQTNANQFAANTTLTIAKAALLTNTLSYNQTNTSEAVSDTTLTISGLAAATGKLFSVNSNGTEVIRINTNGGLRGILGSTSVAAYGNTNNNNTGLGFANTTTPQILANGNAYTFSTTTLGIPSTTPTISFNSGAFLITNPNANGVEEVHQNASGAVSNRLYRIRLSTTVGDFLESGFDEAQGWAFIRQITNNSGATTPTKSLNISSGTNAQLMITSTGSVAIVVGNPNGGPTLAKVGGTLSVNTTAIANAGTAQTNLMSYSVPANSLTNTADRITFTATGRFAANADAKELLVTFGSETILDTTSQIVNSGSWTLKGEIIRTGNTAQSAWAEFSGAGFSLFTDASSVTLAQTNGQATLLAIAGTAGGSGDITNRVLTISYFPAP